MTRKQEDINRQAAEARALTFKRVAELEVDDIGSKLGVVLAAIESEVKQHEDRQKRPPPRPPRSTSSTRRRFSANARPRA